jgi:hypothetical protein
MPILAITLALAAAGASPSASTLAAVKIFAVNVDRKWPADDGRGEAATSESLRLMSAAVRAMADDWKVEDGKLRDAIADFDAARETLFQHPRGDKERPELTRAALDHGRKMIDRLAEALHCDDLTAKDRAALEKLVKQFEKDRPVREQADDLETYFKEASKLLQSMLDAAPSTV